MVKTPLNKTVLQAAKERIEFTFDNFERIYISFSGGKDSSVMLHLVMEEAVKRNQKIGLLFIDWECQFEMTIEHVRQLVKKYEKNIDLYWICGEILTNSACSSFEPTWKSWDVEKEILWARKKPVESYPLEWLPFYYSGITFEEFVPLFAKWYSQGKETACFLGLRSYESLNRFRVIARDIDRFKEKKFTTRVVDEVWNVLPIYDWRTQDIWTFNGKFKTEYNRVYDLMYKAGMSIHQMRIDEPFGDEARKGLWLYQIIEPATWSKFVARMAGVNHAALYSGDKGNILGNQKVSLPPGHTWQSFAMHILGSMPAQTAEHYKNKIAKYIQFYKSRGYPDGIPDAGEYRLEQLGKIPAWRQICKTLLRNDYWCRGLGFSITKSSAYKKYMELMKKRRTEWNILANE